MTISSAGISRVFPSRITGAKGLTTLLSARMVLSALLSVAYPIAALITTTPMIATASIRPPVSKETPAAAPRRATGRDLN